MSESGDEILDSRLDIDEQTPAVQVESVDQLGPGISPRGGKGELDTDLGAPRPPASTAPLLDRDLVRNKWIGRYTRQGIIGGIYLVGYLVLLVLIRGSLTSKVTLIAMLAGGFGSIVGFAMWTASYARRYSDHLPNWYPQRGTGPNYLSGIAWAVGDNKRRKRGQPPSPYTVNSPDQSRWWNRDLFKRP